MLVRSMGVCVKDIISVVGIKKQKNQVWYVI